MKGYKKQSADPIFLLHWDRLTGFVIPGFATIIRVLHGPFTVVTLPHTLNFVKLVLTGVLNSAKDKLTGNVCNSDQKTIFPLKLCS